MKISKTERPCKAWSAGFVCRTVANRQAAITNQVNLHILRYCFASHALEEGMNIKTLQYLPGA